MNRLLIASAVLLPATGPALGHEHRIRVGPGIQLVPEFIGADRTELAPWFDLEIARGTDQFKAKTPYRGTSIALVSRGRFSFGPAGNIQGSRKNSDVGAPVGK